MEEEGIEGREASSVYLYSPSCLSRPRLPVTGQRRSLVMHFPVEGRKGGRDRASTNSHNLYHLRVSFMTMGNMVPLLSQRGALLRGLQEGKENVMRKGERNEKKERWETRGKTGERGNN